MYFVLCTPSPNESSTGKTARLVFGARDAIRVITLMDKEAAPQRARARLAFRRKEALIISFAIGSALVFEKLFAHQLDLALGTMEALPAHPVGRACGGRPSPPQLIPMARREARQLRLLRKRHKLATQRLVTLDAARQSNILIVGPAQVPALVSEVACVGKRDSAAQLVAEETCSVEAEPFNN